MQLYLLTLLLSTTTLALPTTEDTPSLTKRANYAWVAQYAPDDIYCQRSMLDYYRPEVSTTCVPLNQTVGAYIGINWGTWPLGIQSLQGYSDTHCKNKIGGEILQTFQNNGNRHGVNSCVREADFGGAFGSVSQPGDGYTAY